MAPLMITQTTSVRDAFGPGYQVAVSIDRVTNPAPVIRRSPRRGR